MTIDEEIAQAKDAVIARVRQMNEQWHADDVCYECGHPDVDDVLEALDRLEHLEDIKANEDFLAKGEP